MPTLRQIQQQFLHNELDDDNYIFLHHLFLKEYGWIPLEEFKQIPLPMFWDLLDEIKKQQKETKENFLKMKYGKR